MKNYKALFFAGSLFLVFSCKKVSERIDSATNADQLNRTVHIMDVSLCGGPPAVDTINFAIANKIPDQPITPATGGTEEQNAQNNYEKIQWCLLKYGHASVNTGVFPINRVLIVDNANLTSANGDWSTIKAIASTPDNSLIKMYGHSRVSFLTLIANTQFLKRCNSSVVEVTGIGNQVDNNWIKGADAVLHKTDTGRIAGVYIMCGDSNLVWNNKIRNNHSGVIINSDTLKYPNAKTNVANGNDLFYNRSDGLTLVTYGQVLNNNIYRNGWDCQNGWLGCDKGWDFEGYPAGVPPIPGAGIYSENDYRGALIDGNTIYSNNGHNIDITKVQNFVISNNYVYDPGEMNFPETDYGIAPIYGAAFSVSLFDVSDCIIEGNTIKNENRTSNAVNQGGMWGNDPNNIFNETVEVGPIKSFNDLPFHGNSVIAFCLAETRQSITTNQVRGNVIKNNIFIASPNGIGYFASRNTGFGPGPVFDWSPSTSNYYTYNNPNGSNVGSVRCGGNWYAANGGAEVNTDDYQHVPPASSWSGNDLGKEWYH